MAPNVSEHMNFLTARDVASVVLQQDLTLTSVSTFQNLFQGT